MNNSKEVKVRLETRDFDITKIDEIITLGEQRSKYMINLQLLEAKRNKLSKEIGIAKAQGQEITADFLEKLSSLKIKIEILKVKEQEINKTINDKLLHIPNLPLVDIPVGKSEDDNVVIKENKIGRGLVTNVKPHYEIGLDLNIIDFERSVKISGTRFWSYKGLGARLVRALENFMLDEHIKKGYEELRPPVIVKSNMLKGTGQLPKFAADLFKVENQDLYLIPTAEVPLTNWHHGEILDLSKTIKLTAFTPCFRAEAGSGGKDMKGLIRSHQFNKVELVKITTAEKALSEFEGLLNASKNILEKLKLPFQELQLCTGDLGFSAQKTVDLEVWIPSENRYREISSVSTFGDFQARRAAIRYKDANKKNVYAYTINGSGLAIDRTVAAILENYQNPDGTITIPQVLEKYMGIKVIA